MLSYVPCSWSTYEESGGGGRYSSMPNFMPHLGSGNDGRFSYDAVCGGAYLLNRRARLLDEILNVQHLGTWHTVRFMGKLDQLGAFVRAMLGWLGVFVRVNPDTEKTKDPWH